MRAAQVLIPVNREIGGMSMPRASDGNLIRVARAREALLPRGEVLADCSFANVIPAVVIAGSMMARGKARRRV